MNNFQANEDDFMTFLGNHAEDDECDALTICNVLCLAGYIVSMDKSCSKFVLNESDYIMQAPYFIPISKCTPSDFGIS